MAAPTGRPEPLLVAATPLGASAWLPSSLSGSLPLGALLLVGAGAVDGCADGSWPSPGIGAGTEYCGTTVRASAGVGSNRVHPSPENHASGQAWASLVVT